MMALAFQTDTTRTITMMYANAGSNRSYRNIGVNNGHHNISHHGGAYKKQQDISKINQYHVSLLSHLLEKLSSVKEGDGTLLDNCMIVYGSGIADGNSHRHINLPIAMSMACLATLSACAPSFNKPKRAACHGSLWTKPIAVIRW